MSNARFKDIEPQFTVQSDGDDATSWSEGGGYRNVFGAAARASDSNILTERASISPTEPIPLAGLSLLVYLLAFAYV
jgi:hypothetical protein